MSSPTARPGPHDPRVYTPPPSPASAPVGEGLTVAVRIRDLPRARQLIIGLLVAGGFAGGSVTSRAVDDAARAAREAQHDSTHALLSRAIDRLQQGQEADRERNRVMLWWMTGESRDVCLTDPARARRRAIPCTQILEGRALPLDQMGRLLLPDPAAPAPPTFITRAAP